MARKARGEQPAGTFYHVMVRKATDARFFQACLLESLNQTTAKIHLPCIMPNHAHLLVESGQEGLQALMAPTLSRFAQRYNWLRDQRGHVFQDRFKAKECGDDRYLLALIRYIARNPVKAGLVEAPQDWAFSGYRAYLGAPDPLVTTTFCLSLFGSGSEAVQGLRSLVEGREDSSLPVIDDFPEWEDAAATHMVSEETPILIEILKKAATRAKLSIDDLIVPGQRGFIAQVRKDAMSEARALGFGLSEIGAAMGVSANIVWRLTAKGEKNG
jgi:putative transposase